MTHRLWAWATLLTMGLTWGLSFSLARIAAMAGIHPLGITFWEAAGAAIILVIVGLASGRRIPIGRELCLLYVVTGLLGMVVPGAIFFYAAAHVPAGVLSISIAIIPILTFVVSMVLRLEGFRPSRVAGVFLGVFAIVLLVGPKQSLPDPAQLPWVLLSLVAAVCYSALNLLLAVWRPARATSFTSTAGMFVAAALMMVPVLYATDSFVPFGWPWTVVEWSLFGLGAINAISYTLFFYLNETAGPVFSSLTANLVTLFGVIWGVIIFGEENSLWVWVSLATMMAAVLLVTPRAKAAALA